MAANRSGISSGRFHMATTAASLPSEGGSMIGVFRGLACACMAMSAAVVGCSRGPAVGTVTGEVIYGGQPVQKGYVTFTPADGQSQTAGAEIVDGKFKAERVPVTKMKVELHGVKKTGKKIKAYDTPDSPVSDEEIA